MPSVIQLMKNVLPPGSQFISGNMGLYNEVSWVIAVRPTPPGFDGLKGGEFAIIGRNVASGLGVTLTHLITTLVERGVSGIGIMGEVSPDVRNEAELRKIPLIQLPPQTNVNALETAVSRLIDEERQLLYQREREINHALMDLALAGVGSLDIVQKLRELTGRNLGFIDLNYNPHFPMNHQLVDSFKKQVHQAISKLRNESTIVATPVIGFNLTQQQACFLGLIGVGKEIKGYLMLVAPEDNISETDRLAVRVGTLALAVEMSRRQAVEETEARFESDIIEDILTGNFSTEKTEEIAKRLDLNLVVPHVCILARPGSPLSDPSATIRNIANLFEKTNFYYRNDDIVMLFPVESLKTAVELRKFSKTVSDRLATIITVKVTLGVGRAYSGISGISDSFREATQSLTMGLQLFGAGSTTCFADLGIYRLLFSLKTNSELMDFHKEYLGNLTEYEKQHDGELISTLKAFLHHNAVAETAREIHVHRNTLLYRLSRIQEITGADLEDGETRLALYFAILAGEVINTN